MDLNSVLAYVQSHWKQLLVSAVLGHFYGGASSAKVAAILHMIGF